MPTIQVSIATSTGPDLLLNVSRFSHEFNNAHKLAPLPSLTTATQSLQQLFIDIGMRLETITLEGIINEQRTRNGDPLANTAPDSVPGLGTGTNPYRADLLFLARTAWNTIITDPTDNTRFLIVKLPNNAGGSTIHRYRGVILKFVATQLGGEVGKFYFQLVVGLKTNETQNV